MTKTDLRNVTEAYKNAMRDALTTIFGELNQGQRKKLQKAEKVRELLERYGVGG